MPAWVREGYEDYSRRLQARLPRDAASSCRPASARPPAMTRRAIADEGRRMLAALRREDYWSWRSTSAASSARRRSWPPGSRSASARAATSAFLIGGPDGHAAAGAAARPGELVAVAPDSAACAGAGAVHRAALPRRDHTGRTSVSPRVSMTGACASTAAGLGVAAPQRTAVRRSASRTALQQPASTRRRCRRRRPGIWCSAWPAQKAPRRIYAVARACRCSAQTPSSCWRSASRQAARRGGCPGDAAVARRAARTAC